MFCSDCGREHRAGQRFCTGCGAKLTADVCPGCGAATESEARFCGECGYGLSAGPAPEPRRAAADGERKQVTVLFADVAGSMELAEGLDAEIWAGIMDGFFAVLAEEIRRYSGTVDKFTGDGVMAVFGAPVALEDHARRAAHAALRIVAAVDGYSKEVRERHGIELGVRVGLNSGEVVAGTVGGAGSGEYTSVGHTVGLAQRMESLADPGTVCLTAQTAALVGADAKLRSLGPLPVKGAAEPVPVFVLDGVVPRRRGLARWPGRSPLVGREAEAAVLRAALTRAAEGTAQIVGVVGEAGVGKSRLCEEFAQECQAQGISVRRAAGLAHAQSVAMLPVVELFRDFFSITDADDPVAAREKIAARLLRFDPAFEESLGLVCDFLEVPDPERPVPPLIPEVRHRRLFDLLRQVSRRRSENETAVLLLEDLHWWDRESDAFLAGLVSLYLGTRTLLVCNFRPEYEAGWMRHSWYTRLALAPLSPSATQSLVRSLIGTDPTTAELAAQVGDLTGGNPFHIEEVLRTLVEDGTLDGESGGYRQTRPGSSLRVPASVQATLAARIDRLDAPDKDLLQTAAVIGRDVPEAILTAVMGRDPADLQVGLQSLCAAEFLMETQAAPAGEYRFWHPLTAEVAYASLLGERRARLHASVAEALAQQESRADEQAPLIALHYERAGDHLGAARWQERAANRKIYRNLPEAIARLERALELVEGLPVEGEALTLGIRARCTLARTEVRRGRPDTSDRVLSEAARLAEGSGDDRALFHVRISQGTIALMRGMFDEWRRMWQQALPLAERCGDEGLIAGALMCQTILGAFVEPSSTGLAYGTAALALTGDDPDFGLRAIGTSPLIRTVHFRAEVLAIAGRITEARVEAERAIALADHPVEAETRIWATALTGRLSALAGDGAEAARPRLSQALGFAEDSGNRAAVTWVLEGLAAAELAAGRPDQTAVLCLRALDHARTHGVALCWEPPLLGWLADARRTLGDLKGAVEAATEALDLARSHGSPTIECFSLLALARAHRAHGESGEEAARAAIEAGLALAASTEATTYEAFLIEERGHLTGSVADLTDALARYEAMGAAGHAARLAAEIGG